MSASVTVLHPPSTTAIPTRVPAQLLQAPARKPAPINPLIQSCQKCGADLTHTHIAEDAQRRISELEAQVKILTGKATSAGKIVLIMPPRNILCPSPGDALCADKIFLVSQWINSPTTKMSSAASRHPPRPPHPRTHSHRNRVSTSHPLPALLPLLQKQPQHRHQTRNQQLPRPAPTSPAASPPSSPAPPSAAHTPNPQPPQPQAKTSKRSSRASRPSAWQPNAASPRPTARLKS